MWKTWKSWEWEFKSGLGKIGKKENSEKGKMSHCMYSVTASIVLGMKYIK